MTLSDMAREIERRRPGTLPCDPAVLPCIPANLIVAILRDAMVMATRAARIAGGWTVPVVPPDDQPWEDRCTFSDSDHGNDPTRSLFAAFCAAYPEDHP